jgi:hypothetical protein
MAAVRSSVFPFIRFSFFSFFLFFFQKTALSLPRSFGLCSFYPERRMKRESGVNPEQTRCCKLRLNLDDIKI